VHALTFADPVLALDASTTQGSVALLLPSRVGGAPYERTVTLGVGADDVLFPAVTALLADAGLSVADVSALVCGGGPGSFTSLRIAASLAKGLAHGARRPLYAVPSLLLAAASLPPDAPAGRLCVHADALRGEQYALWVDREADGRVSAASALTRVPLAQIEALGPSVAVQAAPSAARLAWALGSWRDAPVALHSWEPDYGRKAEAQVKWEATHGITLPTSAP